MLTWSQKAKELQFLQRRGFLVTTLNSQGPERAEASHSIVGRHWSSISLTFLICKMTLASSPASP